MCEPLTSLGRVAKDVLLRNIILYSTVGILITLALKIHEIARLRTDTSKLFRKHHEPYKGTIRKSFSASQTITTNLQS